VVNTTNNSDNSIVNTNNDNTIVTTNGNNNNVNITNTVSTVNTSNKTTTSTTTTTTNSTSNGNTTNITETTTSNYNATNSINYTNTTTTTTTNKNNNEQVNTTTTTTKFETSATATATVTTTKTTTTNGDNNNGNNNSITTENNSAVNSIKDSNEKDGNNDPILDDTLTNEINTKVDTTESNENIRSENPIFHDKDMMDSDENLGPETIKNKKRYKIVFALGGPGSGKKKQSKKLSELFEYELICTGDVLRKEVEDKGPYADIISNHITVGELVPDDIVNEVIMKTISNDLSHYKFLIEGYPRTVKQAEYFEKNISPFKFILYFKCSETLLTTRFHHQMSESQINIGEDIIEKRMEEYTNNTQKTIDYFTSQNRVKEVSLERTEEEIANRAKEIFVEYDNSGSYEEYHKK